MNRCLMLMLALLIASPAAAQQMADKEMAPGLYAEAQVIYEQWMDESIALAREGGTLEEFLDLPAYRAFVKMGEPVMPFLRDRLIDWMGYDYIFAYAVIEIRGWNKEDFWVDGVTDEMMLSSQQFARNIQAYLMDEWALGREETLKRRTGTDSPYPKN